MEDPLPAEQQGEATAGEAYTARLQSLEGAAWKKVLDVQAPYRANIRRLRLGRTLDVGCGLGRNLAHLGGDGVGVDHNEQSVHVARSRGMTAYTTGEFFGPDGPERGQFDSLLAAHLLEHLGADEAAALIGSYLPWLRPQARICLITPQERGYRSDPTHVRFVDLASLADFAAQLGFRAERAYSFPLPRRFGPIFRYNEFVLTAGRS